MGNESARAAALTCEETGRIGGLTRARKLTPEQRKEIARRAAHARWGKKEIAPEPTDPTDPHGPERDQQRAEAGIMLSGRRPPVRSSAHRFGGRNLAHAA